MEDAEKFLQEMKVKKQRHKAVEREQLAFVTKERKAVRGPWGQAVTNVVRERERVII
jgi:hypothetical protein